MMMMYSLHSTPPHSPDLTSSADNSRTKDIKMVTMWTVPTAVWSVSYWVSQWKKNHSITILPNICKYCPVPNNPMPYRSNPTDFFCKIISQILLSSKITQPYHKQGMSVYSGIFSEIFATCRCKNAGKYAEFVKIYQIYVAYMQHMLHIWRNATYMQNIHIFATYMWQIFRPLYGTMRHKWKCANYTGLKCSRIYRNMWHICGIFAHLENLRIFLHMWKWDFRKCQNMHINMRYADFRKIYDICCNRMIAINQHP